MNPIDFLIIYLACGAPFGVYYFLKNRARLDSGTLWFKSLLVFFFWMPFALRLARRKINAENYFGRAADAAQEKNINAIQKDIERILPTVDSNISVYEFRETIERYVGLTLAENAGAGSIAAHETELHRIARAKNIELAQICLHRRNRRRLAVHQTAAREDFLRLIEQLSKAVSQPGELKRLSIRLAELTNDSEARGRIEETFADAMQSAERAHVKNAEKILWKPELTKPQPAPLISRSPILKATMNWREKD